MSRLDLGIFFLLIVGFLAAGYMRNLVWKDEVEVWRDAGGKSPQKVRPHNNLGNALRDDAGLLHEAVKEYRTAIRIAPGEVPPRHNISVAYLMLGMYDEAEKELLAAIRLMPDHPTLPSSSTRTTGWQGTTSSGSGGGRARSERCCAKQLVERVLGELPRRKAARRWCRRYAPERRPV
jgi:tetratricopeptide (TPR) repeat protein